MKFYFEIRLKKLFRIAIVLKINSVLWNCLCVRFKEEIEVVGVSNMSAQYKRLLMYN